MTEATEWWVERRDRDSGRWNFVSAFETEDEADAHAWRQCVRFRFADKGRGYDYRVRRITEQRRG